MFASGIQRITGPAQHLPRRAVRGSGGFDLPANDAPAPDVAGAQPIVAGLMLQEEERRHRPAHRPPLSGADAAVESFAALQIGLLGGGRAGNTSAALREAASLPPAEDPRLEEILQSIRLRARIELAREQSAEAVTSLKTAMDQPFEAPFKPHKPLGMQPGAG